jgi:hypothetical protein
VRKFLLALAFIFTAACQSVAVQHHDEGPVPVTLRVDDAAYWLEEWNRLMTLPADQVLQALKSREQEFARSPDPRNRLRLALLLAEGPPAVRNEQRALALLAELDDDASASAQALAALLRQVVREQSAAGAKIAMLKQAVSDADERVNELERQLQELADIEQSIQQRETPVERKEKE